MHKQVFSRKIFLLKINLIMQLLEKNIYKVIKVHFNTLKPKHKNI